MTQDWKVYISGALTLIFWVGCATNGSETTVVTDRWSDGSPKREATVADGDTIRLQVFYSDGILEKSSEWKNGKRHGTWEAFYPDGSAWSLHTYENGIQVGDYRTWHPNRQPFIEGHYDATGTPDGTWFFYDEQGQLVQEKPGSSIHNPS
jgi:antitoxin component YwqK of YwqJK toxin-antitoxin module